jgi:hypothetical protein
MTFPRCLLQLMGERSQSPTIFAKTKNNSASISLAYRKMTFVSSSPLSPATWSDLRRPTCAALDDVTALDDLALAELDLLHLLRSGQTKMEQSESHKCCEQWAKKRVEKVCSF